MRFYFITITLFSLTLNLAAQPADTVELSSRQIAQIQDQGAAGIQAVIEESNIDLQDKVATHALVSQIVSSQMPIILKKRQEITIAFKSPCSILCVHNLKKFHHLLAIH